MHIEKYRNSRYFAVYDDGGTLVCITLYRKGAQEVMQRLQARNGTPPEPPAADDHLPTDATRRRWHRALAIAAILFEQDGYHSRYLHELSQFVAHLPCTGAKTRRKHRDQAEQYCDHCACWRPELGAGTCHACGQVLEPF
jgi:hypothetical protein